MAKKMLAAYLPGNSTVEMREIDIPSPGVGQVLVKMGSSGIVGPTSSTSTTSTSAATKSARPT